MVADFPVLGLKFKDYTLKNNISKIILLIVAVIAAFTLKWLAVPVVFIVYIMLIFGHEIIFQILDLRFQV